MGKHFDIFVELTRAMPHNLGTERIPDLRKYFSSLINRAALFEFPLKPQEVFPRTGKVDLVAYNQYLQDYFDMSQKYKRTLVTPFKLTAIEDLESVVFYDEMPDSKFRATLSRTGEANNGLGKHVVNEICTGEARFLRHDIQEGRFLFDVSDIYVFSTVDGVKVDFPLHNPEAQRDSSADLTSAATSFIEELVYLMDPANFIIKKESKQARVYREGVAKGKKRFLEKTMMRPHYIFLGEEDTRNFLSRVSREPNAAHPVRGYWKTLMSPRFVNKQWQKILVDQYFTGEGKVEGYNGWDYQVMIKEGPDKLVPYENK